MRWPNGSATKPRVSSAFGPRAATGGASSYHRGCDFTGFSLVRAVSSGTVRVTGTPSGWSAGGRQVWIQHDGFFSKSLHLASINVKNGQWVNEGDVIGVMGATGTALGVHLHLEITLGALHYSNSGQIDPVSFLAARVGSGSAAGGSTSSIYDQWGGKAWIIAIQQKLIRLGYDLGPWGADGDPGALTQGSIRDFQSKNGLEVDGVAGPLTNAKMDERLAAPVGYKVDSVNRSIADIQRLVGAEPDGVYGPATTAKVMAWQQANGLVADGIWGPASDAKGFPTVVVGQLDVDGILGIDTVKALQRSLGLSGDDVDGIIGPQTIALLQRALGVDDDGIMGPITREAFQRSLGVHVDGQWGEHTIKALQTLLNAGGKLTPVGPGEAGIPEPPLPPVIARTPIYPGSSRGWTVPLSFRLNEAKDAWIPNTRAAAKITTLIVHHTTNPGDEEPYFKTKNSRSSCPSWYVTAAGEAPEMIRPGLKPSATGSANEYSLAIETQNTTVAPNWETSAAALERIADIAAWLHSYDGKELDGVLVEFKLDRKHIIGHSEAGVNATACPGPFILPRLDSIVDRAKAIYAEKYAPKPDPDPDPEPGEDTVSVKRSFLEGLLATLKQILGIKS